MTKHMTRLYIEPPNGNAQNAIDNWVQNHNEWTDDPVEHTVSETQLDEDDSGSVAVTADYRFVQEETPTALLDDLESKLNSFQSGLWYRVGYHECDHDEENVSGCSWEEVRENGTIPSYVPEFN